MLRDLSRLLNPRSIALFGGGWAANVIAQLKKSGYTGDIWPVHPSREAIEGISCFKSLAELPSPPDASFIGINREATVRLIGELSGMGAGGAICFASGFKESENEITGGSRLQNMLVEAAGYMPVLGPNCYGMLNYLDNVTLWPDQHGGRPVESGVAIIGQSSNVLINMTMQKRSLPIAYVVAAGNQAAVGMSDMASHMLDDPRVTALGFFIEGFDDIRKFEAMADKAAKAGKPVVALKSGKSATARASTLSHTASLAGGAAAASAFLKRLDIIEVDSVAVFLETLKLLHGVGRLGGNSVSSVSCSGGEVGLVADMALATSLDFRPLGEKARKRLKDVLGPIVTVSNPLDYHTFIWGDVEKTTEVYSAVFGDGYDLNMVIMDIPPSDRCDPSAWEPALQAVAAAKEQTRANVVQIATLPENLEETFSNRLLAEGIVPMHGLEEAIAAIDAVAGAGPVRQMPAEPAMISRSGEGNQRLLDEAESKEKLAGFGLSFPRSVSAGTVDEIARKAAELEFPLALKGIGIAHKSEAGAVLLDLNSADELRHAAEQMRGVSGFLAEEMVTGGVAELIIGITRDETGLMVLTIGAGGVLTELLSDSRSLIVPARREDVLELLLSLRVCALLRGYRGKPAAHMEAIVDAVMAVQAYSVATPGLIELDINPILALPDRAVAVDALIKLEETK